MRPMLVGVLVQLALKIAPKGWSISLHAKGEDGREVSVRCNQEGKLQ